AARKNTKQKQHDRRAACWPPPEMKMRSRIGHSIERVLGRMACTTNGCRIDLRHGDASHETRFQDASQSGVLAVFSEEAKSRLSVQDTGTNRRSRPTQGEVPGILPALQASRLSREPAPKRKSKANFR